MTKQGFLLKQRTQSFLRRTHLLLLIDNILFLFCYLRNLRNNWIFVRNHQNFPVPPTRLLYEVSGNIDFNGYCKSGSTAAVSLMNLIESYVYINNCNFLEWGCGVSRITRHFPRLIKNKGCQIYATDTNRKMIIWNQQNIFNVVYSQNGKEPPLSYSENTFDFVLGISVMTHLSENLQKTWISEILRVMKPGGVLVISLQSDIYAKNKLSEKELLVYRKGKLVVRNKVNEGSKLLAVFHPENYVKSQLFKDFLILEHIKGENPYANQQDIWVVRKPISDE